MISEPGLALVWSGTGLVKSGHWSSGRPGQAWPGLVWPGLARRGQACLACQAWSGTGLVLIWYWSGTDLGLIWSDLIQFGPELSNLGFETTNVVRIAAGIQYGMPPGG